MALEQTLGALCRFARMVVDDVPAVDVALPAVRTLFQDSGTVYKVVGGLAVIHHGYRRLTEDIDVLIEADALNQLQPQLAAHGFEPLPHHRLRHVNTGVRVDLLVAGTSMPRPGSPCYPDPTQVPASPKNPEIVSLETLLELKLHAGRRQDEADIVALLKLLDEAAYTQAEAALPKPLRASLYALRRDALEELRWEVGA